MNVTIYKVGEYWNLAVDGKEFIKQESFAVVDGVREELIGQGSGVGELREVAESIKNELRIP